jgi:hypothetical protein
LGDLLRRPDAIGSPAQEQEDVDLFGRSELGGEELAELGG